MLQSNGLKYLQIRDLLVDQFRKQEYTPGTKIPTEQELTRTMGVSRTTIRQALGMLEKDGVVERRHGSGTFFVGHASRQPENDQKKGLIGMINFFYMDYIYPEIVRGAEDAAFEKGYYLVLTNCNMDHEKEIDSVVQLLNQGVHGLILEPSRNVQIDDEHPMMRLIEERGIPVVSTHWGRSSGKTSAVTIDDHHAGMLATRYLLDRGHRRIAMIYKTDVESGHDRHLGFRSAMDESAVAVNERFVAGYNYKDEISDFEQGYRHTRRILEDYPEPHERPTAFFYFNDRLAQQGYRAIQDVGLRIPEDISVIGFDNYHTSAMLHPALTTFEHPKYNLGRWAARLLLDAIEQGDDALPVNVIFQPKMVERESVASVQGIQRGTNHVG